jgi:hypothetical protein
MVPTDNPDSGAERGVSERKLNANRANAQKSTGPSTPEGKRRVARNAVKHGILAREVFIGEGDGAEREEDFSELQAGLYAAYAPRDVAEQLEVENIVAANWMLRRAYRATAGDTLTGLDTVRLDWEQRRREHLETLLSIAPLDHGAALRTSSLGCAHLLRLLDEVTVALAGGQISHALLASFLQYFPVAASATTSVRVEGDSGGAGLSPDEKVCRELAGVVASERVALERARAGAERQEQAELSAEAARLALPGADAAMRDLRYITALRRDIARAHKMLVMLRQRPTVEPSDADTAGREGNGEGNESAHHA